MTHRDRKMIDQFRRRQFPVLVERGCKLVKREAWGVSFWRTLGRTLETQTGAAVMPIEHALGRSLSEDESYQWSKYGSLAL